MVNLHVRMVIYSFQIKLQGRESKISGQFQGLRYSGVLVCKLPLVPRLYQKHLRHLLNVQIP